MKQNVVWTTKPHMRFVGVNMSDRRTHNKIKYGGQLLAIMLVSCK